jgi:hypothetical protein
MDEDVKTGDKGKPLEQPKSKENAFPRLTGGLILILLGVLFLLAQMDRISWADWWAYFLVGLGGIFILEFLVSFFSAAYRSTQTGRLIAGLVLIIIGGAHLIGFLDWWPLILIAIGVILLLSPLLKKK